MTKTLEKQTGKTPTDIGVIEDSTRNGLLGGEARLPAIARVLKPVVT